MNVLIADKEARVRSALMLVVLQHLPGVSTVEEACDVWSLMAALGRKHTKLVLLDWNLDGAATAELVPVMRWLEPGLKVIALSVPDADRGYALGSGVDIFVSKSSPPEELLAALEVVGKN